MIKERKNNKTRVSMYISIIQAIISSDNIYTNLDTPPPLSKCSLILTTPILVVVYFDHTKSIACSQKIIIILTL